MTKRQRTFLFLILAALFLLAAPSIALYSQGFRIDWDNQRIAKTGAFYFKATPQRADIFINEKLVKKTDFLFGSALTKNFFPGRYIVEVKKEGFSSWKKILEIKEKEVTEAKNIILFPADLRFQTIKDDVAQFWISPEEHYALLKTKADNKWQVVLFSLETKGETLLLEQEHSKQELLSATFSPDEKQILFELGEREAIKRIIKGTNSKGECVKQPCDLSFLGNNVGKVVFLTQQNQIIFSRFLNGSQIILQADYKTKEVLSPIANNVLAFSLKDQMLFWLNSKGEVRKKDLATTSLPETVAVLSPPPQQETEYELFFAGTTLLLRQENTILKKNPLSSSFEDLLSAKIFALSPDQKKIAFSDGKELWVSFLQEDNNQPQRKAGESVFLTRLSQGIESLLWANPFYLIFVSGQNIKAAEIDERDRVNVADIGELPVSQIFWRQTEKALYLLSNNTFSLSEKLVQ